MNPTEPDPSNPSDAVPLRIEDPARGRGTTRGERWFRSLVQNSSDVVMILEAEGTVRYVSPAVERVLGYRPEDLVGTLAFDHVHPEDIEHVSKSLVETLQKPGVQPPIEYRVKAADGSWRHMEDIRCNWLGAPHMLGVVANVRDITERKQAEEALRESEKYFRSLVQSASDVILVMEADRTVRHVSPAIERVLGYKPEQMVGHDNFTLVHPDDMPRMEKLLGKVMGSPGITTSPSELRLRHADGSWRHVETTCTNLLGDPAVGGIVFNTRDVTERKLAEERLEHQALHDSLTDLPNRRLFLDRLGHALARTERRRGRGVTVLFMDLDKFKVVNDSLGHEIGDRLLVAVAERLKRCLRSEDTLARFGGDEFIALLEEVEGADKALRVTQRITEEFKGPFVLEGRELFVRLSIGVALGEAHAKSPEELLRDADTAMYLAKDGAAEYQVFDPVMHERALSRLELEGYLRHALEKEEFTVYYQPKFRLGQTDRIEGLEALVRWKHPQEGFTLPGKFIPIAEETGQIVPLGRWVMNEACRQAKEWQERYPIEPPLAVCVNLGAAQVRHPRLLTDVRSALGESGLAADRLVLEVTEGVLLADAALIEPVFRELKALGVRLAIDDFGKEYSSLSYLNRLPIDVLKIDRLFLESFWEDSSNMLIVEAVISLAHSLGLEVTGEGVESAKQLEHLRRVGCDLAQGCHLARPRPPEDVPALLSSERKGTGET
ncbi:MAG: EAL domain-containing protein [Rubrobacteraceae bacterium]|nr:EAL domain-containing protein [Rubrobacteraceae bacterium]